MAAIPPVPPPPYDPGLPSATADPMRQQRAELYKRIIAAAGALLLVFLVWRMLT